MMRMSKRKNLKHLATFNEQLCCMIRLDAYLHYVSVSVIRHWVCCTPFASWESSLGGSHWRCSSYYDSRRMQNIRNVLFIANIFINRSGMAKPILTQICQQLLNRPHTICSLCFPWNKLHLHQHLIIWLIFQMCPKLWFTPAQLKTVSSLVFRYRPTVLKDLQVLVMQAVLRWWTKDTLYLKISISSLTLNFSCVMLLLL